MAQRTVALYDGKYIGIETIYTVINGRQINIPDKLKDLREKSRRDELFCPCGCGKNLVLVAGDRNLREQYFREKNGTGEFECTMPVEGKMSVASKIVLKCWLDDKLKASDLETRVPIANVESVKRKPEFTFLSREKKVAIRYWYARTNIMDDKLDVLSGNLSGIRVFYIVDKLNSGCDGQYPEAMMKIQNQQNYCLFLKIKDEEYDKATLTAVFYDKNIDGMWNEVTFLDVPLKEVDIDEQKGLLISEKSLERIYESEKETFVLEQEEERQRRIETEKIRQEQLQKMQEEVECRKKEFQERQKQQEEEWERLRIQREAKEKQRLEYERIQAEKAREEAERKRNERNQREENFKRNMAENFSQQKTIVRDAEGNRWVKCEYCGRIARESEFNFYGGTNHINLGTCKECAANNPAAKKPLEVPQSKKKYDPMKCPECGEKLVEKYGRYGMFVGCSGYPKCRYIRQNRSSKKDV